MSDNKAKTRRNVLAAAAAIPGLALLASGSAAMAVTQANAKYRPQPNGAAQCGKCNYFLAGASPTAAGKCKVVEGAISPNGWCQLFAAKRA